MDRNVDRWNKIIKVKKSNYYFFDPYIHRMDQSAEDRFPKATVSETNGEISCSIEETNRIRISLGLKPLNLEKPNKEREAVDNFRANAEKHAKYNLKFILILLK